MQAPYPLYEFVLKIEKHLPIIFSSGNEGTCRFLLIFHKHIYVFNIYSKKIEIIPPPKKKKKVKVYRFVLMLNVVTKMVNGHSHYNVPFFNSWKVFIVIGKLSLVEWLPFSEFHVLNNDNDCYILELCKLAVTPLLKTIKNMNC